MTAELMLIETIPGYRAWTLDDEGHLWPAANGNRPWDPGVNVARCVGRDHDAPATNCSCGLYAFHTVHRQLRGSQVIGGIAAWGAIEVHRDGFRAGRARILALASHDLMPARDRRALARAAERYGVPVVTRAALQPVTAARNGLLPQQLIDTTAADHERWLSRRRGYDSEQQIWVEPGGGAVTIGISASLRAWMGGAVSASVATDGPDAITLTVRGERASVELAPGVQGRLIEVNPRLASPSDDVADADGAGWIARIETTNWIHDCASFDWGPRGRAGMVGTARRDGAAGFGRLLNRGAFDSSAVSSWADVLREMRRRDARPASAYDSDRALYDDLGITLGRALASDASGRQHLQRLACVVAFEIHEPSARLVFDLRRGQTALRCGPTGPPHDISVAIAGDDLRLLLAGKLDLARETRSGRLKVTGPRIDALTALSFLSAWSRRNRIATDNHVNEGRRPVAR